MRRRPAHTREGQQLVSTLVTGRRAHRLTDISSPCRYAGGVPALVGRRMPPHDAAVLWTNGCILLMLWALGYVAGGTVGQWVHLLLGLALVLSPVLYSYT